MKKFLIYISVILICFSGIAFFSAPGRCLEGTEYQIKAAMIVNFIQFVEWPDDPDLPRESLVIGIIGKNTFGDAFDHIEGRIVNGKQLILKRFASLEGLNKCQVLFVPASESYRMYEILKSVSGYPVLTIGETDGFIRLGGIIRFYLEENHIRFEINKNAALDSNLKISAKLMEIARVIG